MHYVKDSFVEAFEADINDSCLRPSELKGAARQKGDQPLVTYTRSLLNTVIVIAQRGMRSLVILP